MVVVKVVWWSQWPLWREVVQIRTEHHVHVSYYSDTHNVSAFPKGGKHVVGFQGMHSAQFQGTQVWQGTDSGRTCGGLVALCTSTSLVKEWIAAGQLNE